MQYGIPGMGVVGRTVFENSKCSGCMHFLAQQGPTGICEIGTQPALCGEGDLPFYGYSPIDKGGAQQPAQLAHPARDSFPSAPDLGGDGPDPKSLGAEVVDSFHTSLGMTYIDPYNQDVVKSIVAARVGQVRAGCDLHGLSSYDVFGHQGGASLDCSCRTITTDEVAKAFWDRQPNKVRAYATFEKAFDFVEKEMKRIYAPPGASKRPPAYLPGVHDPKSPMRVGRKGPVKPKTANTMTIKADEGADDVVKGLDELEALVGKAG